MKSIIPLLSHEELCNIKERYELLLRCKMRVSMLSLDYAAQALAVRSRVCNGFTQPYLPNIEERALFLAVLRGLRDGKCRIGAGEMEYVQKQLYRTARTG